MGDLAFEFAKNDVKQFLHTDMDWFESEDSDVENIYVVQKKVEDMTPQERIEYWNNKAKERDQETDDQKALKNKLLMVSSLTKNLGFPQKRVVQEKTKHFTQQIPCIHQI